MNTEGTLGLVVCGGKSRRMGTDKALEDLAGSRLVDRAVASIGSVADEVLLATGSGPRYSELGLECVLDEIKDAGPLAGLVAGLRAAKLRGAGRLAVSACDTPRALAEVFQALSKHLESALADAVLLRTQSGLEPLIAIYRVSCLAPAAKALKAGRRRMTSFHEDLEIDYIDEANFAIKAPSTNVNTPEELAAERCFFSKTQEPLA